MKEFVIVIQTEYGELLVAKTKSVTRQSLKNSDLTPSKELRDKLVRDTVLFSGFNKDQIANCKVVCVEELEELVEL